MAGRDAMNAVVAIMGAATLLAVSAPAIAGDRTRGIEFLPMSRDQVFNAGAAGTGCSFLSNGGKIVFAAAGDRAVVRLPIGIVRLKPAPQAGDLFPWLRQTNVAAPRHG